jgi:hypothetical protein
LAAILFVVLLATYLVIGLEFLDPLVTHHMTVAGADSEAVIAMLAGYEDFAFKTGRHPLFLILLNPIGTPLAVLLGSDDLAALVMNVGAAALMAVLFFALLRRLGLRQVDAFLFTALLGLSSSHLVVGSIPETFIFSGLSVLSLICVHAFAKSERTFWWCFAPLALLSFGMAVTNLVPVTIILLVRYRKARILKRTLMLAVVNIAVVLAAVPLALLQGSLYRNSIVFVRAAEPFTGTLEYISLDLFKDPIAHLTRFLPSLVTENLIARRGVALEVIDFEGYVTGNHLAMWLFRNGEELILARVTLVALFLVCLGWLWRDRSWRNPVFAMLGLYFLYCCVFHLIYDPEETFILAPQFTFAWLGILAMSFAQLEGRSLRLPRLLLVLSLAAMVTNNVLFVLDAVHQLNSWIARNPTL